MGKRIIVIGAGFGGLSAAGYLAKQGHTVTILEKNSWVGGRAQVYEQAGFRFDMGPSWYLLHEEHDKWFKDMGVERAQYYNIKKLTPQYKAYFGPGVSYVVPSDSKGVEDLFESIEGGAGKNLTLYLDDCHKKYDLAIDKFLYRNFDTLFSMISWDTISTLSTTNMFSSYRSRVNNYFRHPHLRALLEYPTVFLGSSAKTLPAVYTLMNWVDFGQGAYYPEGGFGKVVESMASVVKKLGVMIETNCEVTEFVFDEGKVSEVLCGDKVYACDLVVANADYHHVDQVLVPKEKRLMSEKTWTTKKLAPSTLNFYIALDTTVSELEHHTFFFDADWEQNFADVYEHAKLNKKPLFYAHVPSKTDPKTAPKGCTSLFILIPVAPGTEDDESTRNYYLNHTIKRIESLIGQKLLKHILFYKSYGVSEYTADYNAYKGNAFGLGHTLFQTAALRPPNRSSKIKNLYFCGQYTIPGTGTSMSMIGGKVVAERINKALNKPN